MSSYLRPIFFNSGLCWVLLGFSIISAVNLATFFFGPSHVLQTLSSMPGGLFFAQFIFDTPGTIGGLLGVVLLFSPILVGTDQKYRVRSSAFFFVSSVSLGVLATYLWNEFYNNSGAIPYGSSSIAIAAQAIICALALFGLVRLATLDRSRDSSLVEKYRRYSLAVVYTTLILTGLWYVLILQPVDVPTDQFNWRIHEIAFVLGTIVGLVYGSASLIQESRIRKRSNVVRSNSDRSFANITAVFDACCDGCASH